MILQSEDKQFTLAEDGKIHWQQDASNPLTGPVLGRIVKGSAILSPNVEIGDSDLLNGQDKAEIQAHTQGWLDRHLREIVKPLFTLADEEEGMSAQAKGIVFQVHEALGIMPREEVQSLINDLDEDGRAALRKRRLRMGPLLVYLPELMKPAAVRLQALLWNLWHDLTLPAVVPNDGIVSFSVKDKEIDQKYYRAIGYPVYGPRAIRVDMLDRVVCAVYDSAKEGKFEAQHQMAEWLGSNIADLYDVLSAMGHKKIHDPLEEKLKAEAEAEKAREVEATPDAAEEKPVETSDEKPAEEKKPDEKPQLATFALKRGKASEKSTPRTNNKPQSKPTKKPHKNNKPKDNRPRNIQSGPKPKVEDSPFAILQNLKLGNEKE